MNRIFLTITHLFCILFSYGQKNIKKYYKYVNKAELAICDFEYEKASQYYEKAFSAHTPFIFDLYNASRVNVKFTKNYDLALKYAKILQERNFEISAVYSAIDPKDSLVIQRFKNIEDSIKPLVNKNLMLILDQMLEEDQKEAKTSQEQYEKCKIHHTNILKLAELKKEYGSLTEQKVGFYEYSPINIIMVHAAQNQMSPQELMLQDVLNGNINAENYMQYFDLYILNFGERTLYGTGWFDIYISNNILFINYPEDISKCNEARKKINIAETFEDYVKKAKYQYINGNFQMVTTCKTFMDEAELKQMMQEIDEEHQKGIYKREYVIREKK